MADETSEPADTRDMAFLRQIATWAATADPDAVRIGIALLCKCDQLNSTVNGYIPSASVILAQPPVAEELLHVKLCFAWATGDLAAQLHQKAIRFFMDEGQVYRGDGGPSAPVDPAKPLN